jgi:hypothetical protein
MHVATPNQGKTHRLSTIQAARNAATSRNSFKETPSFGQGYALANFARHFSRNCLHSCS